ncbi:hypothetical protein Q9R30_15630 [Arthrobacter sp. AB6]|uniref:hypothetical protein n=1 Tax=Arthrobacter sp. AB6 TaxID=2962570 RepID=UPI002880E049|nr:hypothetical protein [Arthrobacter sp. AB6]MDT0196785.1 hypothetical protein [Arthrobacter sp. AB6]
MPDPGSLPSPFPMHIPGIRTYATASELLGERAPLEIRIAFWEQLSSGQALSLIAQILTDIEVRATLSDGTNAELDRKWAAKVRNPRLRTYLEIGSTFGVTLFAPQMLLLAAKEALLYCPEGPAKESVDGLDMLVICLLGIADDNDQGPKDAGGATWGGMDVSLASELIANYHFNRTLWVGRQLVWFERTWFRNWPKRTKTAETVGGEPQELFHEATGVELVDFAAVAFNIYAQASVHGHVRFPDKFFTTLGLPLEAIEHFLAVTSYPVAEIRKLIRNDAAAPGSSRFQFDAFRRYPLIRLESGELLMLSPNFVMQRALSETTFWDVRQYLRNVDRKREEAFHQCTRDILEYEAGAALRRIFFKRKLQVFDEERLRKRLAEGRKDLPRICDYAVRSGHTWLLIEVTERAMPRPVVFANASSLALDDELDKVLTARKAQQLSSTISLLEEEARLHGEGHYTCVPLVLTGETGLPWTIPVQRRAQERLLSLGHSEEFSAAVAMITLKDLIMLENAADLGHDILEILVSWRRDSPSFPLDQHLQQRGVPLNSPGWERNRVSKVVRSFAKRMGSSNVG